MGAQSEKENLVKMQKLRRAVDRLRKVRSTEPPARQQQSWLGRWKERLLNLLGTPPER